MWTSRGIRRIWLSWIDLIYYNIELFDLIDFLHIQIKVIFNDIRLV